MLRCPVSNVSGAKKNCLSASATSPQPALSLASLSCLSKALPCPVLADQSPNWGIDAQLGSFLAVVLSKPPPRLFEVTSETRRNPPAAPFCGSYPSARPAGGVCAVGPLGGGGHGRSRWDHGERGVPAPGPRCQLAGALNHADVRRVSEVAGGGTCEGST